MWHLLSGHRSHSDSRRHRREDRLAERRHLQGVSVVQLEPVISF